MKRRRYVCSGNMQVFHNFCQAHQDPWVDECSNLHFMMSAETNPAGSLLRLKKKNEQYNMKKKKEKKIISDAMKN